MVFHEKPQFRNFDFERKGIDMAGTADLVTAAVVEDTAQSIMKARWCLQATVGSLVELHSTAAPTHPQFRELRTSLTNSALLYREVHFPLSSKLVIDISNLMDLYDTMYATTFCDHISAVSAEVKRYADIADDVIEIHKGLLGDLRALDMKAQDIVRSLQLEAQHRGEAAQAFRELGEEISKKEKRERVLAAGSAALWTMDAALFAGIPIISGLWAGGATILTATSAHHMQKTKSRLEEYRVLSLGETKEGEMARDAAENIEKYLISTVENFINAVEKIAGFLQKLAADVSKYATNASRMAIQRSSMVLYLNVIKKQSSRIQEACRAYLDVMPSAEGQLSALSQFGTSDPNYIQNWLMEKLPKCKLTAIYQRLRSNTPLNSIASGT